MPARPGAFTANFALETLDDFRETCKSSGLQYTKVLEELAELYLDSKGFCLEFQKLAAELDQKCSENIVLREKLEEAGISVEGEGSLARNHKEVLYKKAVEEYEKELKTYDGLGPQPKSPELRVPPSLRAEVDKELNFLDKWNDLQDLLKKKNWHEGLLHDDVVVDENEYSIPHLAQVIAEDLSDQKKCIRLMHEVFTEAIADLRGEVGS